MTQAVTVLTVVAGVLAMVGALGGIAVYLGRRVDTGTIASQARQIKTFSDELGQVRGALATASTHITDLEGRVATLEEENATLLAIRPSAEAIAAIDRKMDESLDRHEAILAGLEALTRSLDATRP